jgi:hypothetical protein
MTFVGVVLPRDKLGVKLSHTVRNGNMVIKVKTTNQPEPLLAVYGFSIIDSEAQS